jgi:hypothetical protein
MFTKYVSLRYIIVFLTRALSIIKMPKTPRQMPITESVDLLFMAPDPSPCITEE